MPKPLVFILIVIAVIIAGYLAYVQTSLLM
jgi:hypothetical protein